MAPGDGHDGVVDLLALARDDSLPSPRWAMQSGDLNANLLVFSRGDGVAEHVNAEVDVLVVVVDGEGLVTIDGTTHPLRAGQAVLVPRSTRRSLAATGDTFAYVTCHRRRSPLVPRVLRRDAGPA